MRLVCPNCDATYEVPDSVIPPEGRDVQCSNCGKSWFFDPNAPEPEPVPVEEPDDEAPLEADVSPPMPDIEPEPAPVPAEENPFSKYGAPPEVPSEEPDVAPRRPRRTLDDSVTDVLREEAAFEARARAEDSGMEFQDDLPLDDPPPPPAPEPDAAAVAAVAGSRRDLLPDIDEINSTLRATSERKASNKPTQNELTQVARRRQGFRLGMGLAALVLACFTFAYTLSDELAESVPALAPYLESYVAQVNAGRAWLENAVAGLVQRMGA